MIDFKKQNASKHYEHYPEGEFPLYLAYAFRAIFLLLAPYLVISIILWSFVFAGYINMPIENLLNWHIYEMMFGAGSAMIIAFFLTGLPELFPGVVPIVGRQLAFIVGLWVAGRVGFWFMDFLGVFLVAIINIALTLYITFIAAVPVFKDPNKKHVSLAYSMLSIIAVQAFFFASVAGLVEFDSYRILLLALGLFLVLMLLAYRRFAMESIDELMEHENIDDTFFARPFRYNLAIFSILIYSFIEFFYPTNSTLAYIAFAAGAAILGILNDYKLEDNVIIFKPFVLYLITIIVITALGFFFIGYARIMEIGGLNHFRHFLTTGTFGIVFYVVMIIISTIHTGRHIFTNWLLNLGIILMLASTFIRSFIPYYEEYTILAYIISSILWAIPFVIYMKQFFPYLLSVRADGIKG